jgi:hypothetical protein
VELHLKKSASFVKREGTLEEGSTPVEVTGGARRDGSHLSWTHLLPPTIPPCTNLGPPCGFNQRLPLQPHPKKSAGFVRREENLAEDSPSVEDTGGTHEDVSHGNCEPSADLKASEADTLYKSNMIQFGVPDSNHEQFYKNWNKQSCKLWFFDNGRRMKPAQISSQAV